MEQEGEIPEAVIVTFTTRLKFWSSVTMILLVSVGVVLATVLPQVLEDPTPSSPQEIRKGLESLLIQKAFDNGTALQTPLTPQNNALNWLANNTHLDSYLDAKKIQRYALATLFFSTNGTSWFKKDAWMSNEDECGWSKQITCPCENGSVEKLSLSYNNLVGKIQIELALLSKLGKSSIVWLLVAMIVLCVFHCTLMFSCHFSFYRVVLSFCQ
jgi:hypothetical protein